MSIMNNIFILDEDLETSCQYHGNRQVLTCAFYPYKILYSIAEGKELDDEWFKWAKATKQNRDWLVRYGAAMVKEYGHRYPKFMPLYNLIAKLKLTDLPDTELTAFPQVMPDVYKHENVIEAYRNYFVFECEDSFRWLNRDQPYWV